MKEGISYSFLLNIVILFIFVAAAIVMGIFSYYRAFRANTIVVSAIEKFEGYNCLSAREAAQKLSGISYNVPFNVSCNGKETPCVVDPAANYAVVSYNLDTLDTGISPWIYKYKSSDYLNMNSQVVCKDSSNVNDCQNTKKYQYGVYTYMYVDLPVVSSMLRIPFFAKTTEMHEFRNLLAPNDTVVYDSNFIPENIKKSSIITSFPYNQYFSQNMLTLAGDLMAGIDNQSNPEGNAREHVQYAFLDGNIDQRVSQFVSNGYRFDCGFTIDYSKY